MTISKEKKKKSCSELHVIFKGCACIYIVRKQNNLKYSKYFHCTKSFSLYETFYETYSQVFAITLNFD